MMIHSTLSALSLNITDGKHGDCENSPTSGYYFISCKDVRDGTIHYEDARQITERDFLDAHKRTLLEPNDILITNSGTIGRMAFVTDTPQTSKTTFQKSVAIVKPNPNKIIPKYLYYVLLNSIDSFITQANGSAQKNLLLSTMRSFNLFIDDDKQVQARIASILSAYDDLIENNQKQIKLLEEAAQRLYKEWFVDLRFPGWENTKIVDGVPEGWTATTLNDVIDFDPKVPLSKDRIKQFIPMSALSTNSMCLNLNEITFTQSNSGSKFQNGDTLLARITPCLENGKTAFVSGIISDEGAVGSTEYIVMRSKKLNPYMVYLLARTNDFRQAAINSMSGSDGRQRVKNDKLKQISYILPSFTLIDSFSSLMSPIFKKIYKLNESVKCLSSTRNFLINHLLGES